MFAHNKIKLAGRIFGKEPIGMAEFGEKLRKAREEKGMTQQTLADKIIVTRQTVSRWEGGSRYPDLMTLKKIVSVLGVTADMLLSDEELENMVEKTPVTDGAVVPNLFLNNLLVALYSVIVLLFAVEAGNVLVSYQTVKEEILNGEWYVIFMAIKDLVEAGLFFSGFVFILKGKDTPGRAGFIASAFFIMEAVSHAKIFWFGGTIQFNPLSQVVLLPYIAGAVGAYAFFYKKQDVWAKICVYAASVFGIFTQLYSIYQMVLHAQRYVNTHYVLTIILKTVIYLSFLYQIYALEKRRTRARENTH